MHAGSFEYIGARHRATQRLYLSDLIKTHTCQDPGYGKLHIGLYIAALEDAENRVLLLCEQEEKHKGPGQATGGSRPEHDRDDHGTEGSDSNRDFQRDSGSGTGDGDRSKTKTEQANQMGRKRADHHDHSVCFPLFSS
jgi:hypothetical protein